MTAWTTLGSSEEVLALVKSADEKGEPVEVFFHDTYGDVVDHAYVNGDVVDHAYVNGVEVLNAGANDECQEAYWTADAYGVADSYWRE